MAAQIKPLQPLQLPSGPSKVTAEQRYWRSFKSQLLIPSPHSASVTHISCPPTHSASSLSNAPSDTFAVTSGGRLQIFSSRTRKLVRTINRFGLDDVAHSGEIRRDGRVLVAGGDSGTIQVFDTSSRAILKTWKEHKQPVWTTRWSPSDPTALMSTSDDQTVRIWDLPSQESTVKFTGHQDYVRCGHFMPGQSSNLLVSGSYDQTVRLWDQRAPDRAAMIFKHAAPVETVLPMPSGTTLISSADNQIFILDLVAARPLQSLRAHQKTVTSLCLASNSTRLVSGALDGHLKVFETTHFLPVASSKYPSPILSLSVIPNPTTQTDQHLAIGLQSGLLSLKTRPSSSTPQSRARAAEMASLLAGTAPSVRKPLPSGIKKRLRGLHSTPDAAITIDGNAPRPHVKLVPWQNALHATRYADALDLALGIQPPDPGAVFTLLEALGHRSALRAALRGRDENALAPILKWLTRQLPDPRHTVVVTRVAMLALEMYAGELGSSVMIDGLVERMHDRVREQVDGSQAACSTQGMLEMLMA